VNEKGIEVGFALQFFGMIDLFMARLLYFIACRKRTFVVGTF